MSILAVITSPAEVRPILIWSARFARGRGVRLSLLLWAAGRARTDADDAIPIDPAVTDRWRLLHGEIERAFTDDPRVEAALDRERIDITEVSAPTPLASTLEAARREEASLLVVGAQRGPEQRDSEQRDLETFPAQVLRHSPIHTAVLYWQSDRSLDAENLMLGSRAGPHDRWAATLLGSVASSTGATLTAAIVEGYVGRGAREVAKRTILSILRDAHVEAGPRVKTHVFLAHRAVGPVAALAEKQDLVVLGAEHLSRIDRVLEATSRPTIILFKKAPPLRFWKRRGSSRWLPILNPVDYADLYETLQTGSRWDADFVTMLGLATAIASLGLIQDSPAIVIGSMLLAPLMTPMLGAGLALTQLNPALSWTCTRSIGLGCLLSLVVSLAVGALTPGEELTPQLIARGEPNLIDLVVAIFSAAAGAYAMARPSIVGAVAGVAIATALVPPLSTVGVSLAYGRFANAGGAATLFLANLVAIMLGAALTFRLLGVTGTRSPSPRTRHLRRARMVLVVIILVLVWPLFKELDWQVRRGKPRPLATPVSARVLEAIVTHVERTPGLTVFLAGRPQEETGVEVTIAIASEKPLPKGYAVELREVVRKAIGKDDVTVEVICLRSDWDVSFDETGRMTDGAGGGSGKVAPESDDESADEGVIPPAGGANDEGKTRESLKPPDSASSLPGAPVKDAVGGESRGAEPPTSPSEPP